MKFDILTAVLLLARASTVDIILWLGEECQAKAKSVLNVVYEKRAIFAQYRPFLVIYVVKDHYVTVML